MMRRIQYCITLPCSRITKIKRNIFRSSQVFLQSNQLLFLLICNSRLKVLLEFASFHTFLSQYLTTNHTLWFFHRIFMNTFKTKLQRSFYVALLLGGNLIIFSSHFTRVDCRHRYDYECRCDSRQVYIPKTTGNNQPTCT